MKVHLECVKDYIIDIKIQKLQIYIIIRTLIDYRKL